MKLNKIIIAIFSLCMLSACNEDDFLKEEPLDFLGVDNSVRTAEDCQVIINGLYAKVRANFYSSDFIFFMGTDVAKNARHNNNFLGNMKTWMIPEQSQISELWKREYKLISNANMLIERVEALDIPEDRKKEIRGEAKFFRAFGYRTLVYCFGGVPLVLEESKTPRTDFTRASKEEVLSAMKADFKAAAEGLGHIGDVADGRVSAEVAKHYLAETMISLGEYKDAAECLGEVIANPDLALMTERFGAHKGEEGDVIHDLFIRKNQNRKGAGNTEAMWVIQMEVDVDGGFLKSTAYRPYYLERMAAPVTYSLKDPEGKAAFMSSNGRSDLNVGGRGVANMSNTEWWLNDLWANDFDNDLRNSRYNIVRDAYYDLPSSKYYGKSVKGEESYSKTLKTDWWRWYPWPSKITTPGDHPESLYSDPENKLLKSTGGATYLDQYMLRLPEVYLLRAEAYLALGDKASAAGDINVVRRRAKASEITSADVSIDYILDERAREMVYEEFRRITLGRLGKYVERVRKCNEYNGPQMEDRHELFPIPYDVIEANKDAKIEQNPGYGGNNI